VASAIDAVRERRRWLKEVAGRQDFGDPVLRLERSRTVRSALRVAFGASPRRGAHHGVLAVSGDMIVGGTMLGRNMYALETEFSDRTGARTARHEVVYHVSIACQERDGRSEAAWRPVVKRFAAHLGFGDAAYVAVLREAPTEARVHLIAARFDAWGRRITAPNGTRAEQILAVARGADADDGPDVRAARVAPMPGGADLPQHRTVR